MPTIAWEEVTRARLFVRGDLPTPAKRCRENMTTRLEALVANGVIEEFSVTPWAKRVPLSAGSDVGETERELFCQFSEWARTVGVRLAPFFDTRECYSSTTGEKQTQLVLPAACVALYDGDELLGVVPHATESGSVSINDCFDSLLETASDDEPTMSPTMAD